MPPLASFFQDVLRRLKAPASRTLELKAPVTVSLEITARCNRSCPGCGNVFERGKPDLSAREWEIIIERLSPMVEEFRLTGGEPTLKEDLQEILEAIEKRQKYFHLFTNALWDKAQEKIALFSRFGFLASFLVSLHAPDAETQTAFSGENRPEDFSLLLENLKKIIEAGFTVYTNTVLTRDNYQKTEAIAQLAMSLGVRGMVFARHVGGAPENRLTGQELKAALENLSRLKNQGYPIELGNCFPYCFYPDLAYGCLAGITFAAVSPWGDVRPCSHSPLVVGNLLKEELTPIWKSKPLRKWRENLPKNCLSCAKITFCPGGCKAQAELEGADELICGPVKESPGQLLEVNLEEDLFPALNCSQRPEDFGLILIKQHQVIPLTHKGGQLAQKLDGSMNLKEIQQRFGASALSFIYSLYIRGMVDLNSR